MSYCLRLTPAHAERLAAAVRSLLDSPGGVGSWVPDAGEAASVEAALRGWLQPQRSVAEVERERTAVQMARLSSKVQQTVDTVDECRQLYSGQATAMLCTLLPWPLPGDADASSAVANEVRLGKLEGQSWLHESPCPALCCLVWLLNANGPGVQCCLCVPALTRRCTKRRWSTS